MAKWWKKIPFLNLGTPDPVVPVLRLHGPIGMPMGFGKSLSLAGLAGAIEQAFEMKNIKAVALQINSPGGSPVQSMLIFNRIRLLAKQKEVPVIAFAEDAAASGGYILALAGDEIYADPSSIIGSIGVISQGFGFDKLIEKIGVDRRVYTAGESKSLLDAFKPEVPEDVERIKEIQSEIHASFISLVKDRRGNELNEEKEKLFTGAFWTGTAAKELGLIDGLGDLRMTLEERFGEDVELKLVTPRERWWQGRGHHVDLKKSFNPLSVLQGGPSAWAEDLLNSLEVRSLWSRFGL